MGQRSGCPASQASPAGAGRKQKWDASPDARVFTFHLRRGVKFHDGTPFNAAAVKANFDRIRNPENKLKRYTLYKIIVKPVPEDGTRIAMLQKGDAQFINPVPYIQAEVVKADKNLSLAASESIYTFWLAMNVQKKPFSDLRVRQAMNYAINKEAIIKAVLRGHGKLADSPLAPQVWGYTPVKTYPYDPAKARALLADAGYPNGFKTLLRGVAQTDPEEVMVAIQGQLKQVGVDAEILSLPSATLTAERFLPPAENKGEMDYAGWSPSTGDADWGIRPLLTKDNWPPSNFTIGFYSNPKVEELVKAALQTSDGAKRKAAYSEAQRIIMDDCPWIARCRCSTSPGWASCSCFSSP